MKNQKGCFNENCDAFKDKIKFPQKYKFCPMCAQELDYVCNDNKCYNKIDNCRLPYCPECQKKRDLRKEARKNIIEKGLKHIPEATITAGASAVVAKVSKTVKNIRK